MRATVAAAFAIGFALGVLVLGVALWLTGGLRSTWPAPWENTPTTRATSTRPHAPEDTSMPNLSTAPKEAPITPPSDLPQSSTVAQAATTGKATQGGAERATPADFPDQPIVPVPGVAVNQIHDTFNDQRDGHKHEALDIMAPRGTPVLAAVEGNVAKLFQSKDGGNTVYQFDDSQAYCYYYAHLDQYAAGLKEGTLLRKGQVLGYVGTTGDAPPDAPHLHFAVFRLGPQKKWWKGTAIDPMGVLRR
jgi:murein DD-endopeptidase MepM/ murein hydrolase activator NlpD